MSSPDPDDDPHLKSLRAVWLSLPDEEPPQRGLAELMAAARAQAEVMARPPWWRRILDVMRRPPVLALATIVVLIGGAVLVGKHDSAMEVEHATPAISPAAAPAATPPVTTGPAPADPGNDEGGAGAPAPEEKGANLDQQRQEAAPAPRKKAGPAPAHSKAKPPMPIVKGAAGGGGDYKLESDDRPASRPARRAPAADEAPVQSAPAPKPSLQPPPAAPSPAQDRRGELGGEATTTSKEAAPSAAPLAAQCLAAAARGDCPTARGLAAQLARQDRDRYASVIADPAVQRCLAAR